MEITLDGGASWRMCALRHQIPPTRYGRHWCWLLWSLELPVVDVAGSDCREVAVRAWDAGTNTQPEHLTWNLLVSGGWCHQLGGVGRVHTRLSGAVLICKPVK